MRKIHQFNLSSYISLLKYLKSFKPNFKKFDDNIKKGKNILMRHDIDFCPLRALEIAKVEKKFNVTSTFFFLVNTNFYNICSSENNEIITEILKLGHDIGLHFDASFFKTRKLFNFNCKKELQILENIIKKKINIISFHRPSKILLSLNKRIKGLEHTYMNKFTKNIYYCSDSQGLWRFKTPYEILNNITKKDFTLHLLTHPIWWTTPAKYSPAEKIDFHLKKKYDLIRILAAKNCKPYSKYIKNIKT